MDRKDQDFILTMILVFPMAYFLVPIAIDIKLLNMDSDVSTNFIGILFVSVSSFVFARVTVGLLRLIPIMVQMPFAYYQDRKNE